MKKKHLYLIFSLISMACLFALAATCNMCGHTITNETEEEFEEQLEEESVSVADETQNESTERDTQTEDQVIDTDETDADSGEEVNHDPIIMSVVINGADLELSDEFNILTEENANFRVEAQDEDGDELSYSASDSIGNNMETERIDNNTAEFGWVAPSDPGSFEIYIEVSDDNGGDVTAAISVTVEPAAVAGPSESARGFGAVASMSGQVNQGGEVFISADSSGSPAIYVGDQAVDIQTRGFLSFDIRSIEGENVTGAWLTIRDERVGDPTRLMREMRIGSTDYGNSLDGADYGTPVTTLTNFFPLSGSDFSFTNEALINAVQNALTAGRQYFQVKLVIDSVYNNHAADGIIIYLSDVMLEVGYTD